MINRCVKIGSTGSVVVWPMRGLVSSLRPSLAMNSWSTRQVVGHPSLMRFRCVMVVNNGPWYKPIRFMTIRQHCGHRLSVLDLGMAVSGCPSSIASSLAERSNGLAHRSFHHHFDVSASRHIVRWRTVKWHPLTAGWCVADQSASITATAWRQLNNPNQLMLIATWHHANSSIIRVVNFDEKAFNEIWLNTHDGGEQKRRENEAKLTPMALQESERKIYWWKR